MATSLQVRTVPSWTLHSRSPTLVCTPSDEFGTRFSEKGAAASPARPRDYVQPSPTLSARVQARIFSLLCLAKVTKPVVTPSSGGNPAISWPWNFQHNVHIDDSYSGFPPTWVPLLAKLGFSEEEIAVIQTRRPLPGLNTAPPPPCVVNAESTPGTNAQASRNALLASDSLLSAILSNWQKGLLKFTFTPKGSKSGEDNSISHPWNFKHIIHVDNGLAGMPPSWLATLPERGYSEEEIAKIRQHLPSDLARLL